MQTNLSSLHIPCSHHLSPYVWPRYPLLPNTSFVNLYSVKHYSDTFILISHYIRLTVSLFFNFSWSTALKYSLYFKETSIYLIRRIDLTIYILHNRDDFFSSMDCIRDYLLRVIKLLFLLFRYYQIVRFILNSTLVTPLSLICKFIINYFVRFVNSFPQIIIFLFIMCKSLFATSVFLFSTRLSRI